MRYRMTEADRAKYGGPEVLELDEKKLLASGLDELEAIEDEMPADYSIAIMLARDLPAARYRGKRAGAWLALRQAGFKLKWDAFKPDVAQIQVLAAGELPKSTSRRSRASSATDASQTPDEPSSDGGSATPDSPHENSDS